MGKRFVTAFLAVFVCAACAFSLSACGGGNGVKLSKGAEVTEEEWKAAFSATRLATNVTFTTVQHSESTSPYGDTYTTLSEEKNDYKIDGDKVYYDTAGSATDNSGSSAMALKHYGLMKDNYYWSAIYKHETYGKEFVGTAGTDWSVSKNIYRYEDDDAAHYAGTLLSGIFETFENYCSGLRGEKTALEDLYGYFTFNDGFYVAELPSDGHYYNEKNEISVAIKDGFVIGIRREEKTAGTNFQGGSYYSLAMKNYGKTTVKFPKDVQKAFNYALNNAGN